MGAPRNPVEGAANHILPSKRMYASGLSSSCQARRNGLHPDKVFRTCRRWLEDLSGTEEDKAKARCWLIRHAVRLPARKGVAEALRIRQAARVWE